MKKSSLIAVATVLLALSGCSDHSVYGPQTELDEKEYNSFDFSTINNNVAVNIEYSVNLEAGVFFSIYDQEPGSWVENAYVLKDGIQPLYSGWTSKDGTFSASLSLPSYLKKVYVYTPAMFSTRIMEAEVNGSQINAIEANYAAQAITRGKGGNGQGSLRPAPGEPGYDENNKPQQPTSNKNYSYMVKGTQNRPTEYNDGNWYDWLVTYNEQGMLHNESLIRNNDKNDKDLYLGKKLAGKLYEVHQAVINVNQKECPQELRSEYDMLITKEGEIAINFLGGSTCWNSSLGYYVYRDGQKPASLDQANVVLVFPNTQDGFKTKTYNGESTKGVFTGSCVKLKYYPNIASGSKEGATYKFPAGYRIGFVLATNAWSNRIKNCGSNYRVRSATSSGLSVDRNGKIFDVPRTAVYKYKDKDTNKDYVMVSFEDNTHDNNFSDVVFTLTTRATIDKIPDVDPKVEVNELKGIYAFEDLWPAKGDYDMNDVMTKSTYTKLVDSENNIYEESYTFKTYGNYATLVSGLAVRLDGVSATDKLEFYVKSADAEEFSVLNTTYDTNDKVVVLANDVNNNKGAEYKVKVIHAEESPVEKQTIEAEPFIFRAKESGDAVAWWEVHLTGYKPTSKVNVGYFNTGDDCSQPDKDIFYVRKGNYPFAFFLAGATDEDLKPMLDPNNESMPINKLYSGYSGWVTSNGATNTDWYKSAE